MQDKSDVPEKIMPSETNAEPQGETLHHATVDEHRLKVLRLKRTEVNIT